MSYLVLITGSRNWIDLHAVYDEMSKIPEDAIFMQGGCATGADMMARMYCDKSIRPMITIEAQWHIHGITAGPIRNRKMLNYKPDLVIAFRKGVSRGTIHCVKEAERDGIPVKKIGDW